MSTDGGASRERGPRRARYLIPKGTPRRAQVVAALGTALVLAHLLAAQLTGIVAIVAYLITWLTRWRRSWLWAPVAVGVLWALAIGPAHALDAYVAGPRQVLTFLGGIGGGTAHGRLWHLGDAFAGMGGWLPGQLPVALIAGGAEAAIACWMTWLHTDEWRLPEPRPGLVVAFRRIATTRRIHAGAVVTKDGAALGVARATGRRASLSWTEADHGVLVTGVRGAGKTTTAFQLAHAAIRRRKPVIAVDLTGSPELIARTRDACAATGTPFHLFTADGPGWYEPLRGGDPARRAMLVAGMVNWTGTGDQYRRTCTTYLKDLLTVVEAAPSDARTSGLDEITHLLDPEALRARAARIPEYHPHRQALLDRVQVSASAVTADPQATGQLHAQLTELHASPLGRRLRPDPFAAGTDDIDLSAVVHERGVVLFSLEPGATGHAAGAVAGLIAQDVLALGQELRRIGVAGDGLVWLDEAEPVGTGALVELVAGGREAGLATVLTTSSVPQDRLLDAVGAHIVHRTADRTLAGRYAAMSGERLVPSGPGEGDTAAERGAQPGASGPYAQTPQPGFARRPVITADEFADRAPGEFTLVVAAPRRRVVPLARTVRSRITAPSGRRHHAPDSGPAAAPAMVPPPPGSPGAPAYDTPAVPHDAPHPATAPPHGPSGPSVPRAAPPAGRDPREPPLVPPVPRDAPPPAVPPVPAPPGRDPRDAPPMPPSAARRSGPTPPSGPLPGHHRRS